MADDSANTAWPGGEFFVMLGQIGTERLDRFWLLLRRWPPQVDGMVARQDPRRERGAHTMQHHSSKHSWAVRCGGMVLVGALCLALAGTAAASGWCGVDDRRARETE